MCGRRALPLSSPAPVRGHFLDAVRAIGREVVAPAAADVDRAARFPREAVDALREAGLLGIMVPRAAGGGGLALREGLAIATELARHCASTAMIWSMHQIQVACLARHGGDSAQLAEALREVAHGGILLGSATSEAGIGGGLRQSSAAVRRDGDACSLAKSAPTVSYGFEADALLITARRESDAPPTDQVLALVRREQMRLTPRSRWDTLGMRGTCSPGFDIEADFPVQQILPIPFGQVASQTMVPYSHLLWAACWIGIASDALERARAFARRQALASKALPATLLARLTDIDRCVHLMHGSLARGLAIHEFESSDGSAATESFGAAIDLNAVKLSCSELVVEAVSGALAVCGMAGYSESSPFSVARHLRDAYSASLMIANDRLLAASGAHLLTRSAR
ncbi:acyl-CoA dehydrogenase family protein [Streptosporangium sp. NPDC051023]|uniref:acyl-CoA dehydrogenase family protein n=1 Tax=Streptosporangium sp. NPDC051023 TaxID=3155410 RepID=UPI0034500598